MPPCRAYALSAATYKKLLYPRKKIRLTRRVRRIFVVRCYSPS